MANDPETTHYYVRGTDPTNNEQIAFECVGLAVANAKAAELRMGCLQRRDSVASEGVGGRRSDKLRDAGSGQSARGFGRSTAARPGLPPSSTARQGFARRANLAQRKPATPKGSGFDQRGTYARRL